MSEDVLYTQLVGKLARYDLILEQLEASMKEGFQHLSRANYHNKDSLRGAYGKDYWDDTYTGYRFVSIDSQWYVKEVEETTATDDSAEKKASEGLDDDEKLRKRRQRQNLIHRVKKDPIYMFGGVLTTPMSLRQSQSSFKSAVPLMLQLVQLRHELMNILDRIEDLKEAV